ncbi:hypothetical protein UMZ34_17395 [Halopseudomonas pachastrellae]|nr:hypothetical protein UMZ34_17395 [Halopseudomonas pachastrellae]
MKALNKQCASSRNGSGGTQMKVSNRPSFNVLAALVSAARAYWLLSWCCSCRGWRGASIKLRSKAAEIRASLYEVPTNTYLAEDGSERFKEMLRGRTQSEFSATHSVKAQAIAKALSEKRRTGPKTNLSAVA